MSDELSLEQRLVMQLSAAMNHEESPEGQEGSRDKQQLASQSTGGQPPPSAQPNQLHGDEQGNVADLSNLFSSIGLIPSLNVEHMGANTPTGLHPQQSRNQTHPVNESSPTHQELPHSQVRQHLPVNTSASNMSPQPYPQQQPSFALPNVEQRQNATEQNISTDALISSLLYPNSGGINLANIDLNSINLKEISLDTLNYISNTLGSNAARQASSVGNLNLGSLSHPQPSPQTPQQTHIVAPPQVPQIRGRTNSFLDQTRLSSEIQAALSDSRLQHPPTNSGRIPPTTLPGNTNIASSVSSYTSSSGSKAQGETSISIDPDVSKIQSVLQSLFGGSHEAQAIAGPSSQPLQSSATPTAQGKPQTEKGQHELAGGLDLSSFGLGTEDQTLIDSLRSVFDGSAQTSESESALGSLASLVSPQSDSTAASLVGNDATRRSPQPPRMKKPRTTTTRGGSYSSYSSKYKYQSDYTDDSDTLRAIQQALLGALPASSSTSLTEALSQPISDRIGSSNTTETIRRALEAPESQINVAKAAAAAAVAAASTSDKTASSASSVSRRNSVTKSAVLDDIGSLGETDSSRVNKLRLVDNRKKIREDNAARKRRWREVNLLQNRDNDLRARILKRASELYGPGDSSVKAKWIEDEFNRRRQRRILRAGINSIVENARARQAKASQEGGGASSANVHPAYGKIGASGQQGTLSQQSKQAATSHLSKLFKSSNAALEQHLYTGKLPVPLVPYMLVPFPKRPTYKVPKSAKITSGEELHELQTNSDDTVEAGRLGDKAFTPSHTNKHSKNDKNIDVNEAEPSSNSAQTNKSNSQRSTETTEHNSHKVSDEDKKTLEKSSEHTDGSKTSKFDGSSSRLSEQSGHTQNVISHEGDHKPASDGTSEEVDINSLPDIPGGSSKDRLEKKGRSDEASGVSGKDEKTFEPLINTSEKSSDQTHEPQEPQEPQESSSDTPDTEEPSIGRYNEASDRPKHRYTLIGNIRLGVPPNLAAIHRKLLGAIKH